MIDIVKLDMYPVFNSTADELCDPQILNDGGSGCEKALQVLRLVRYITLGVLIFSSKKCLNVSQHV